jgi:site-specific recombinase XerC
LAFAPAVEQFLNYLQTVARRSPCTVNAYRSDLARFAAFLGDQANQPLAQVTPPMVELWMGSMQYLSDATLRRALNALSSMFRWAKRFGHCLSNPVEEINRPRRKRRIQPCPTPEQVSAMLDSTKGTAERAALLALATSGLRRAELLALDWRDVNLQTRRLRINGKGSKQREVLIFGELLPVLYALHAEAGFPDSGTVFCGRLGKPLQRSSLQAWLNKWLQKTGLRDPNAGERRNRFSLHSLRRFAAKSWLNSGMNIRQVQLLLGHDNLQTTMLYLNYDLDELEKTAAAVDFKLTLAPLPR